MNQNVERLVARYEDARGKLRREVEAAIRTLEEAKARFDAGEVPTPALSRSPRTLQASPSRLTSTPAQAPPRLKTNLIIQPMELRREASHFAAA